MSRRGGRPGFTLVELLIALALLALMAVALSGALGFGSRAWETASLRTDETARLVAVQGTLRRLLAQATPEQTEDAEPAFDGGPDRLRFVAPLPAYLGVGGHYAFDLELRSRDGRRDLVIAWRLLRGDEGTARTTVLMEGVERLAFAYLEVEADGTGRWRDAWRDATRLPALIGIDLTMPGGDPRRWPRLVVAPRLAAAAGAAP